MAIKDIQAGEELLVDYEFCEYFPPNHQWYKDAELREVFQKFFGQGLFERLKSLIAQLKSLRARVLERRA